MTARALLAVIVSIALSLTALAVIAGLVTHAAARNDGTPIRVHVTVPASR